jgi:hypothetical protein
MSLFDFFGFEIKRKDNSEQNLSAVVPQTDTEGGQIIDRNASAFTTLSYNLDFTAEDSASLINKYRELSIQSDVESAIDEIINEAIYIGEFESPISLNLDNLKFSDNIKDLIQKEFQYILNLLNFNENAYEIFKRWYVDGRLYFNIVINLDKPKEGIQELRYIDPRKLKKIKEVKNEKIVGSSIIPIDFREYYLYDGFSKEIPVDAVASATSGLVDDKNSAIVLSYLHGAIKPYNQLRMLEDSMVIYYLSRATERRVFNVEVDTIPQHKVEQYMNAIIQKFKNKIAYDSQTGNLRDDVKTLSIMEDFWFPMREGKGTTVTSLAGGQNLNDLLASSEFFQRKFYRSLRVPMGRIIGGENSTFNTGRATEIAREEQKFSKFIKRLRMRFSSLFTDMLRVQLVLKNIISAEEWNLLVNNNLYYDFRQDSHFAEYNESEIESRRMELAAQAEGLRDHFSKKYIQKNFLRLSEEDIKEIEKDKLFEKNKKKTPIEDEETMGDDEFGDFSPAPRTQTSFNQPSVPPTPATSEPKEPETPTPTQET